MTSALTPVARSSSAAWRDRRHRVRSGGRPAVGDDDEQRAAARVAQPLEAQRLARPEQALGQRRTAPARQVGQPARGDLDRGGGRQGEDGLRPAERHQPDLVAALVGVEQQREHGGLDRLHALARGHRARGVDREQHEVGLAALGHGVPQVGADELQPTARRPPAGALVRGGGADRGAEVQGPVLAVGQRRADGPSGRRHGPAAAPGRPGPDAAGGEEPGAVRLARGGDGHRDHLRCRRLLVGRGRLVLRGRRLGLAFRGLAVPVARAAGGVGPGRGGGRVAGLGVARVGRVAGALGVVRLGARRRLLGRLGLVVAEQLVEQVLVEPGGVERVAPPAVRQREPGGGPDVGLGHAVAAVPGGVGDGGAGGDEVGPEPVDLERRADLGDEQQLGVAELDGADQRLRAGEAFADRGLRVGPRRHERLRVRVVRHPPPDDLGAQHRVPRGGDLDGQPEPVEQLRAELALLGVHGADEHEPGGVGDGDALALDRGPSGRRGVEQQVDQVVVQQVDLVDVEQPAVRGGQQAGGVDDVAGAERLAQVERADHAVLGRADRQLHEPRRAARGDDGVVRAVGAGGVRVGGVAAEAAALDDGDRRQHGGERADGGGLRGALLAADEDAADLGRDGGQHEGEREVLRADDGGEGERARRAGRRGSGHVRVDPPAGVLARVLWVYHAADVLTSGGHPVTVAGPLRSRTGFLCSRCAR